MTLHLNFSILISILYLPNEGVARLVIVKMQGRAAKSAVAKGELILIKLPKIACVTKCSPYLSPMNRTHFFRPPFKGAAITKLKALYHVRVLDERPDSSSDDYSLSWQQVMTRVVVYFSSFLTCFLRQIPDFMKQIPDFLKQIPYFLRQIPDFLRYLMPDLQRRIPDFLSRHQGERLWSLF
jgi:hypothetical protein